MADELIDIYDINMNHIGTAMKSQAHNEGLWHKTFHCWIVQPSKDGKHQVWLQLRSKNKNTCPNQLDISAAGHVKSGEKPRDGIRELKEELGLKVNKDELNKLFIYKQITSEDGSNIREFNNVYALEAKTKLEDLKMQPEEVDGVFIADMNDFNSLINNKKKSISINGLTKDGKKETRKVTLKDVVPNGTDYYTKVFDALKRFCDGLTK